VHVCGTGYLAAATRVELARLGIHRDADYHLPPLHPPLVIACGDSEDDEAFDVATVLASRQHSPLLLACLTGDLVRIGPLIEPPGTHHPIRGGGPPERALKAHDSVRPHRAARLHDASGLRDPSGLRDARTSPPPDTSGSADTSRAAADLAAAFDLPSSARQARLTGIAEADPRLSLPSRVGALLVCAQTLSFLLGARNRCVVGRVVEMNPWSIESRAYKVIKVRQ
jgi:hypothetical protein